MLCNKKSIILGAVMISLLSTSSMGMTSLPEESERLLPFTINGKFTTGIGVTMPSGIFYPYITLNNQVYAEYKNVSLEFYLDISENNRNYSPYKVLKEEFLVDFFI
jgi:hypothetical protein